MLNIEHYEYFQYPNYVYGIIELLNENDRVITVKVREADGYTFAVEVDAKTLVAVGYETNDEPARLRKKGAEQPKDKFHVTGGGRTWVKDTWVKLDTFETIAEAKDRCADYTAKAHATDSPFAFKISKETVMSPIHNYHEWGQERFASGEYQTVPWAEIDAYPEHFARMSKGNDGYVAYWDSPTSAQRDAVRYESAGTYLNRYYKAILRPEEIERYVHKMNPPGELELSGTSPDDIYNAYMRAAEEGGVSSCMSHDDDDGEFEISENPIRVYGAGDLQVLMLNRRGRIVARALCWPEKKVVGRMYGDIGRMQDAIEADGWTRDGRSGNDMHTNGAGGFNGARVMKIQENGCNFIAPYIDFMYKLEDKGDHFVMSRTSGYQAHRTDGLLHNPESFSECDECGAEYISGSGHYHNSQDLCSSCYENLVECSDCPSLHHRHELTDGRCETCEEQNHDVCA